jgi:hypothetical protein
LFENQLKNFVFKITVLSILHYFWGIENFVFKITAFLCYARRATPVSPVCFTCRYFLPHVRLTTRYFLLFFIAREAVVGSVREVDHIVRRAVVAWRCSSLMMVIFVGRGRQGVRPQQQPSPSIHCSLLLLLSWGWLRKQTHARDRQ